MPIGRFARACRLSVKSLRNYDQSGLLRPALVDPQSGYRYYELRQLARAEKIRALRSLDMPLPQIAEILDGREPEKLLVAHLAALTQQRDDFNLKVQNLKRLITRKEITMSTEVTIKSLPAITVISHRTATTVQRIVTDIPDGLGRAVAFLEAASASPSGIPFTLYHQMPDGDAPGEISLCIPIDAQLEPADGIEIVEMPACTAATVVSKGPYDDMGDAYASIAAWIHEHGHSIAGPNREVYLNTTLDVQEADLLTELQWPIDDDDTEGHAD